MLNVTYVVKPIVQDMRKAFIFLIAYLLISTLTTKAQNSQPVIVGHSQTITSEVYGVDRTIQISLPYGYEDADQQYPVLYLLDGQQWFLQALSLRQVLAGYDYTPEFIIVGIVTSDNPRFGFFAQSDKLMDHLEKEVIPYLNEEYRTNDQRMLFGWQFAGAFTLRSLAQRDQLFDGWFAASPFPIQGAITSDLANWLQADDTHQETVLMATSLNENNVEPGVIALASRFEQYTQPTLRWQYKQLKHETEVSAGHRTTPLGTLYQGLRFYFGDYPNLEFNSLEQYDSLGGFDYVKRYYQERGQKYGIATDISQEGMFFLVRLGLDTENYPTFAFAMEQFWNTGFLQNTNLGWTSRYGEFYLKHNHPDEAIRLYEILAQRFSNSGRPLHGLGMAYEAKGERVKAKEYYQRAIEKAKANGDNRLSRYEAALERLNNDQ